MGAHSDSWEGHLPDGSHMRVKGDEEGLVSPGQPNLPDKVCSSHQAGQEYQKPQVPETSFHEELQGGTKQLDLS